MATKGATVSDERSKLRPVPCSVSKAKEIVDGASIATKERSTRTPETGTTAVSSSLSALGAQSGELCGPTWRALANSYSEHGLSIDVTGTVGASGAPLGSAG